MKKITKRIICVLLVLLIIAGCCYGGYSIYRSNFGGAVAVYALDNLAMTDYWEDNPEYDGVVGTEGIQTVTLSETQTVEEVMVQQGDEVKKGDPLFSYDSTLTNLDLQKKELSIQQMQLDLAAAQKELKTVSSYRPGVPIPGSQSGGDSGFVDGFEDWEEEETVIPEIEGLELLGGDGTQESPYQYDWLDSFSYTPMFITAVMQGQREAFVTFRIDGKTLELMQGDVPMVPSEPVEPNQPDDPDEPDQPDDPDEPDQPDQPDEPDQPDQPDEPDQPDQPDDPDEPDTPDQPDTPDEPDQSGDTQGDSSSGENLSARAGEIRAVPLSAVSQAPGIVGEAPAGQSEEAVNYAASWTIQFQQTGTECQYQLLSIHIGGLTDKDGITQKIADPLPALPEEPEIEDDSFFDSEPYVDPGIVYTRDEIDNMIQEQRKNVRDLDLQIRQAKLEYSKLQSELNNSVVYSELDGIVSYLGDPEDSSDEYYMKIYAGGGYVIQANVNELVLDSVQIGQLVSINDWNSGSTYEGTVKAIGEYPSGESGWYGNSNSSYYPITVEVDNSENLVEGYWVGVTLENTQEGSGSIYVESAFVRTENGKSYVYVQGEDGLLEKRQVITGKSLWGYYQEIKSGITIDERIAFPYGKNVKEGASTREAEIDELYAGMM